MRLYCNLRYDSIKLLRASNWNVQYKFNNKIRKIMRHAVVDANISVDAGETACNKWKDFTNQ